MMGIITVVLAIFGIIVLAVVLLLVRLLTRRQDAAPGTDETQLAQEMFRTLDRLEKRVDVLETLLAEKRPTARHTEE